MANLGKVALTRELHGTQNEQKEPPRRCSAKKPCSFSSAAPDAQDLRSLEQQPLTTFRSVELIQIRKKGMCGPMKKLRAKFSRIQL